MSEDLRVSLFEIIYLLINKLWFIVLTCFVFLMGAYLFAEASYSPKFIATTSFVVNTKQNGNYSGNKLTGDDIVLAQQLVDTYTLILKSDFVMNAVIDKLDLKIESNQLSSCVSLSGGKKTQVMYLEVVNADKRLALDVAKTITAIAPEIMMRTVEIGSINVLDEAHLVGQFPKKTMLNSMVGGLTGIIVSILLIIIYKVISSKIICAQNIGHKLSQQCLFELEYIRRKQRSSNLLLSSGCSERIAESYMKLGIFIKHSLDSKHMKKLLVTSVLEGEGKTMVSVNLALALTKLGHTVLLIDCNLGKPRLGQVFSFKKVQAQYFNPNSYNPQPEKYLVKVNPNFFVMPFIMKANNQMNFKWKYFNSFLETVEPYFDYIIFDSAQAASTIDTLNLVEASDGVLMVLKQNNTGVNAALKTIAELHTVGADILGCVLNEVKHTKLNNIYRYNTNENNEVVCKNSNNQIKGKFAYKKISNNS